MVKMQNVMDTDSIVAHVKTGDIYKNIAANVETRFGTSIFKLGRLLPKGKNKVIKLMKDELGGQIMKEFVELRAKTYSYLKGNDKGKKKRKRHKKSVS